MIGTRLEPGIGAVSSMSSRSNGNQRSLATAGQIEAETRAQTRQPAKRRRRVAIRDLQKSAVRAEDGRTAEWSNEAARPRSASSLFWVIREVIVRALSKEMGPPPAAPCNTSTV